MQDFLSDQQLSDIKSELQRLMCITRLCDLEFKIVTKKCTVSSIDQSRLGKVAVTTALVSVGVQWKKQNVLSAVQKLEEPNLQLLQGNQFAPEMDGASHPAWSEAANLAKL